MTSTAVASVTETGKKALTGLRAKKVFRNRTASGISSSLVTGTPRKRLILALCRSTQSAAKVQSPTWLGSFQVNATTAAPHASSANS